MTGRRPGPALRRPAQTCKPTAAPVVRSALARAADPLLDHHTEGRAAIFGAVLGSKSSFLCFRVCIPAPARAPLNKGTFSAGSLRARLAADLLRGAHHWGSEAGHCQGAAMKPSCSSMPHTITIASVRGAGAGGQRGTEALYQRTHRKGTGSQHGLKPPKPCTCGAGAGGQRGAAAAVRAEQRAARGVDQPRSQQVLCGTRGGVPDQQHAPAAGGARGGGRQRRRRAAYGAAVSSDLRVEFRALGF